VFEWADPAERGSARLGGRRLVVFWSLIALGGAVALALGITAAVVVTRDRIHVHRVDTITTAYAKQLTACVRGGTSRQACSVTIYARCMGDSRWSGDHSTAQRDCAAVPGLRR
jgi:hypothetical protein